MNARVVMTLAVLGGAAVGCGPDGDGDTWQPAFAAEERGWFLSAWGSGPDDVYAVGGTLGGNGIVMHYDGAWSELDLGVEVPLLNWVHGRSPTDVTFVGVDGAAVHWNGTSATVQDTPTQEDLWGVWGASEDDLWAVGGAGRDGSEATLLHYDGQSWSAVEIPDLQRPNVWALFKIWGSSADNIYAVGQRGAVLHYDGTQWTEELVGASDDLISLWGTGPDNIVAVGGRNIGIASHWDGSEWTTTSLEPLPGLNGVWMRQPGIAHAVGMTGTVIELDVATLEATTVETLTEHCFHGVFGTDGSLLAVGGNILVPAPPFIGVAYERRLGEDE